MKKVILVIAFLMLTFTASAQESWDYWFHGATRTAPYVAAELSSESGAGAGWYVALMSGETELGSKSVLANNAGNLYVAVGAFGVDVLEGTDVFIRIYNDTVVPSGSYWQIDSASMTLHDATAPLGTTALDVQVDFSSSSWQAVPEPATAMLLALGGGLAWLVRMKQRMI